MVVSDFTFVISRTLLALPALFSTQGLLACGLFPGLVGRSHSQIETLAHKLQQFFGRAESQLGAGINLVYRALELAFCGFRFWSKLNYERSTHNRVRVSERGYVSVTCG